MKREKPQVTLRDIRALAAKNQPAPEVHSRVAMERLPQRFLNLAEIKNGKEFLDGLRRLIEDMLLYRPENGPETDPKQITTHTVLGLSQMIHDMRDRRGLSGSRRKSFAPIIAAILQIKARMGDRIGLELVKLIDRTFWPPQAQEEVRFHIPQHQQPWQG